MATIRITRELLEYVLDLPEGVHITGASSLLVDYAGEDSTPVLSFDVTGPAPYGDDSNVVLALQYEENEHGCQLVAAIPVE